MRLLLLLLLGCTRSVPPTSAAPATEVAPAQDLDAILTELWEQRLDDDPLLASRQGDKRNSDRWTPYTDAHWDAELAREQAALDRIRALDPTGFDDTERMTVRLFEAEVARRTERVTWRHHGYPLHQMWGTHAQIPAFLIGVHRVDTEADAEAYIARLRGVGTLLDQVIAQMQQREALGVLPPAFVFPHVLRDCRNVTVGMPFDDGPDSPLRADLHDKVDALELSDDGAALKAAGDAALLEVVGPAYDRLIAVLEDQSRRATTDDGAWKLPDGAAYYAFRLRSMTTTDLDPDALHQLGLDEVARIHAEMDAIRGQVGFDGDLQAFFAHVRADPQHVLPDTDEGRAAYLLRAEASIAAMRVRLPEVFGRLPQADLEVKAVEAWREQSAGKAFYQQGAPDGSRPGVYYANLFRMADMPTYQLQALAFHEGIPGHHLQGALSQELVGLPDVRKDGYYVAYGEGWGLYAEYLPHELGLYTDPYSDLGRLAMELWRAARLVVDTGIHHERWTRDEAIAWLVEHTPNPEGDAIKAIERYIVTPGQATAYKVGMLHILRLRSEAKEALGSDFDLAAFHDVVLGQGPLPLDVLEEVVDGWVEEQVHAPAEISPHRPRGTSAPAPTGSDTR